MKTTKQQLIKGMLCTLLGAAMLSPAFAADTDPTAISQRGDPERWYQEEMTPMAYFKTLKKEAEAVYQLSSMECKRAERSQQSACLREAKATMQQDIAEAYRKSGIRPR
ncbi:hypothetical protein [Undibacterium pigrum]|uniref:UrcA family protein n=1 Tax=Undibacterium pigrum TaxID=401470 RepID=A0A318JBE9_9BURK|nr:hypothetical protein [Undibacterium pigrum]PXX44036.1 hypothetical protein DFR42_103305 [Undibacterium pigrum]